MTMKKSSQRPARAGTAMRSLRLFTLLALLVCGGAGSQEVLDEASYLIERIVVEDTVHFTPEIIVAESLLREGRVYSERELGDAAHRIVRLPLILDARFALRKGSTRGRFELVISVEEVGRWFVGFDSEADIGDEPEFLAGIDFSEEESDQSFFLGWRVIAGRHGVFSLAGDPFDGGKLQLGYTHFNFLGRSIRVNANYLVDPLDRPDSIRSQSGKLSFGIPLQGNHSLSLASSYRQTDVRFEFAAAGLDFDQRVERLIHNVSWVYNSLDDPIFPTSGRFVKAGAEYRELLTLSAGTRLDVEGNVVRQASRSRSDQRRLLVTGDQYWSLSERTSWSASLELAAGSAANVFPTEARDDDGFPGLADVDLWQASAGVGHHYFLWRDITAPRWRELRWESRLELFNDDVSNSSVDLASLLTGRQGLRFTTGLKYRSRWGVFGISATYRDVDGEVR